MKYELPKPFLVWIILKGLPSSFEYFTLRKYEELAKDINNLDIPRFLSELISEEARINSNIELEANKATKYYNKNNKVPYCKHCNKKGHLESKCFNKYLELRNKSKNTIDNNSKNQTSNSNKSNKNQDKKSEKGIMSALNIDYNYMNKAKNIVKDYSNSNSNNIVNKIILDSGATEHYTPNKQWLLDYTIVNNKSIIVANGQRLAVRGIGKIPILVGDNELTITEVNYIPELKQTLVSTKQMTKKGWSILFKNSNAILTHNTNSIKMNTIWKQNAYYLNIYINW